MSVWKWRSSSSIPLYISPGHFFYRWNQPSLITVRTPGRHSVRQRRRLAAAVSVSFCPDGFSEMNLCGFPEDLKHIIHKGFETRNSKCRPNDWIRKGLHHSFLLRLYFHPLSISSNWMESFCCVSFCCSAVCCISDEECRSRRRTSLQMMYSRLGADQTGEWGWRIRALSTMNNKYIGMDGNKQKSDLFLVKLNVWQRSNDRPCWTPDYLSFIEHPPG